MPSRNIKNSEKKKLTITHSIFGDHDFHNLRLPCMRLHIQQEHQKRKRKRHLDGQNCVKEIHCVKVSVKYETKTVPTHKEVGRRWARMNGDFKNLIG